MTALDGDKVDRALRRKMKAVVDETARDKYYVIQSESGVDIASTSMSHKRKEILRDNRVSAMSRQLCLNSTQDFVDLVRCPLSREEALAQMLLNSDQSGN